MTTDLTEMKHYFESQKQPRMKEIESNDEYYAEIYKILATIKSDLYEKSPLLSYLGYQLPLMVTADPRLTSMVSDMRFVYIARDFLVNVLSQMEDEQKRLKALIERDVVHQLVHFLMDHHGPFVNELIDKKIWKQATEITVAFIMADLKLKINTNFELAKWELPNTDEQYKNKSSRQIYKELMEKKKEEEGDEPGEGEGDKPGEGEGEGGECNIELTNELIRQAPIGEDGEIQPNKDWEIDFQKLDEKSKGQRHNAIHSHPGDLPGDVLAQLQSDLKPKVDWRERLLRYMQPMMFSDYQWNPPNKKYLPFEIIMPSIKKSGMTVALVVDTSASVSDEELIQLISEIRALLQTVENLDLYLYDVDTELHQMRHITVYDNDEKYTSFEGRGGTRFMPVFEDPTTLSNIGDGGPTVVIYYTDGEANDYPTERDCPYPLIWLFSRGEVPATKGCKYGVKLFVHYQDDKLV